MNTFKPKVVLICHENDPIDTGVVAAWLAHSFSLAGIVLLRDRPDSLLAKIRREYRRVGLLRLLDVLLFRCYYQLFHAAADRAWMERERLQGQARYPSDPGAAPRLAAWSPNSLQAREFIAAQEPDLVIARCKFILKPEVFRIARHGTYVLHPGICPEYRNAHGCFWALAMRDLERVGMTLLKVDDGIDTGPVLLQSSYAFDELRESHVVIQYRVVLENLERVTRILYAACRGSVRPIDTTRRASMCWGQPWLTAYLQWKRAAREALA